MRKDKKLDLSTLSGQVSDDDARALAGGAKDKPEGQDQSWSSLLPFFSDTEPAGNAGAQAEQPAHNPVNNQNAQAGGGHPAGGNAPNNNPEIGKPAGDQPANGEAPAQDPGKKAAEPSSSLMSWLFGGDEARMAEFKKQNEARKAAEEVERKAAAELKQKKAEELKKKVAAEESERKKAEEPSAEIKKPAVEPKADIKQSADGPHDDPGGKKAAAEKPGEVKLNVHDPKAKAGEEEPKAKAEPSLSGQIADEVGKLPATFFKQAAASAFKIKADLAKTAAVASGTANVTGQMGVSDDDKPAGVKTEVKSTTGTVTTEVTNGTYSSGYAGTLTYASKEQRAAGAVVAAGYEAGWTSKTIVKEDRFGAFVTVTESTADATFSAAATAGAEVNSLGGQMDVKIKTELSGTDSIKISTTDLKTGITYTKIGTLHAEMSAELGGKAMITWERISIGGNIGGGFSATMNGGFYSTSDSGGMGIGFNAAANADAKAKLGADASWNPVDGYTFKASQGFDANIGVSLGLEPKLANAVSSLAVQADGCFGRIGAHADIDFGYKDGKFTAEFDIGGAFGIGYNLKFKFDIDLAQYATNTTYWMGTTMTGASFNPGAIALSPSDIPGSLFMGLFVNAPPEEVEDRPSLGYWEPPSNSADDVALKGLIWGGHEPPDKAGCMAFFGEAIVKYAKVDFVKTQVDMLKKIGVTPEGTVYKFLDRDASDPNSFSFTPGKNPVHDISDRCAKIFGESNNPQVKSMELTFNKLPPNFDTAFWTKVNSAGKEEPDSQSAFAIFGSVSLVQFLSIKAFEQIAHMDRASVDAYLKSPAADYLTDDAKIKLTKLWDNAYQTGNLLNPYERADEHHVVQGSLVASVKAEPNQWGADLKNQTFDAKLWEISKSQTTAAEKQALFSSLVGQFDSYFHKDATIPSKHAGNAGESPTLSFKDVPRQDDHWHLIDLSQAKAGSASIHDLIYDHTMKKLDSLGSPQAVYQFLKGPESYWIADDGVSRANLAAKWWADHQNGEWSTAEDPDAVKAQQWFKKYGDDLLSKNAYS